MSLISCSDHGGTVAHLNQNPDTLLLKKTVSANYSINGGAPVTTVWHYDGMKLSYTENDQDVRTDYVYEGEFITSIVVNNDGLTTTSLLDYDQSGRLVSIATGTQLLALSYESNGDVIRTLSVGGNLWWTATIEMENDAIERITTVYADGLETQYRFSHEQRFVPARNIVGFGKLYLSGSYNYDYFKNVTGKIYSDNEGVAFTISKSIVYNAVGFPSAISSDDESMIESYDDQFFYE